MFKLAFTGSALTLWFFYLITTGFIEMAKSAIPNRASAKYTELARKTNGQCASPKGIGGCRYDSETIRNTYHEESVTMFKNDLKGI